MVKNGEWDDLKTRLLNRMEFGTAGKFHWNRGVG